LARITNALLELATNPEMPRTVRKTAGTMVRGLNECVLSALELETEGESG